MRSEHKSDTARKIGLRKFRVFQQYRPTPDVPLPHVERQQCGLTSVISLDCCRGCDTLFNVSLCQMYVPAVRRKMIFQAGELSCCSNVYGLFVEHLLRAIMGIRTCPGLLKRSTSTGQIGTQPLGHDGQTVRPFPSVHLADFGGKALRFTRYFLSLCRGLIQSRLVPVVQPRPSCLG